MGNSIDILLVEDDPADAQLILETFVRSGFDIASRTVSTEADLRKALQRPWDVVISDLRLPQLEGHRAYEICREARADTPFLFVSAVGHESEASSTMCACAAEFFSKNELDQLPKTVRERVTPAIRDSKEELSTEHWERHRQLTAVLEATAAGLVEFELVGRQRVSCSEQLARALGYAPQELMTLAEDRAWLLRQIHPEDLPLCREVYDEFLTGVRDRCAVEVRALHRRGHWVDLDAYFQANGRDGDGCAEQVSAVLIEVGEQRSRRARLVRRSGVDAVGRLAGGVAHDFNNLLTAIIGFTSFALEELSPCDSNYEHLQAVLSASNQARSLTSQLLAFAQRRPVVPKPVRLGALLGKLTPLLRQALGSNVNLEVQAASDTWPVRIDPNALEQVFLNLIINAREAMPLGGSVKISFQNQQVRARAAELLDLDAGDYVCVRVEDTGPGIPPEHLDQVMEPFFTTKPPGQGVGLGLSTCYGILVQAGGGLQVDSRRGEGACFVAHLPKCSDRPRPKQRSRAEEDKPLAATILVVDDNPIVRETVSRSVTRHGYRVLSAEDGRQAVEVHRNLQQEVDLLLTDVVMPGMSGLDLAEQLMSHQPGLRVLFMSGYAEQPNQEAHGALRSHPENTLYKPFTPGELIQRVQAILTTPPR